ncbi:MAG: hypothetical protein R3C15_09765 [Thermoleophilia bacterium]
MSSSSGPEGGATSPSFDVAGLEATEQALKQQYRVGEGHGPEIKVPSGHKVTALLALPGLLYLGFFLVAPIVMIVLVSFWTQKTGGFDKAWTLDNYDTIFGSGTYWNQIKQSSTFADRDRRVPCARPADRVLPDVQDQDGHEPGAVFTHRLRAVLDERADPLRRLAVPADGPQRRGEPDPRGDRDHRRAARHPSQLLELPRSWR